MNVIQKYLGNHDSNVHWSGVLTVANPKELQQLTKRRWRGLRRSKWIGEVEKHWDLTINPETGTVILHAKPNLVVGDGVRRSLDRLFAINATPAALTRIGVDNGTTNPIDASVSSDVGSGADTGSSSQTLRTFDSAATRVGASKVVTAVGTFNDVTTGGIGAVGFIMKRLFLSAHIANVTNTTSSDAANSLYSMTNVFTIDFTSISTWSLVFSATVTGSGT